MPRFRIRKAAEADIDAAFAWYESQREGLGLEFLTAVEATLSLIQRKFPYAVFYVSTPQRVSVIACAHARRHPRRWQSRR